MTPVAQTPSPNGGNGGNGGSQPQQLAPPVRTPSWLTGQPNWQQAQNISAPALGGILAQHAQTAQNNFVTANQLAAQGSSQNIAPRGQV